jgi:catecholate siderophore receptor
MRIKIKRRKHSSKTHNRHIHRNNNGSASRTRPGWPEVYKWVATGTLVVSTAIGSKTINVAYAQEPPAVVSTAAPNQTVADQAVAAQRFDIPPGTLDTVLTAFQKMTAWQVIVSDAAIRTLASPGVSGLHTPELALKQLLANTGVTYSVTAPQTATLELETVSTLIEVTAQAVQISSPKYTAPLRDIPQTITVIPRTVIEQQGATTLAEVLRNVPGLTIVAGEGGVPAGDNLTLRGFSARNDVFVDGVRDISPQSRDPFNLEQVEVAKGPQSAFTGRGSTGGSINMVSKAPSVNPAFGVGVTFGTAGMKRATADINTPLRFLGERTGFRINLLVQDAGVPGRDVVENQRWGFAPSLAFGLGSPTRLTLSHFHLQQDNIPDYGIPWVTPTHNVLVDFRDQPAPVPRDTFYGQTARDKEDLRSDQSTVKIEHDFSDSFVLRNQLRYGRATRDSITTAPRFASPDSLVINRNGPAWLTEDDFWDNQTDLKADFSTGGIRHALVTGLMFTHEHNQRWARTVAGAPPTTLFSPNANDPFNGTITLNPLPGDATGNTAAFYVFDTARLGQKFELTGGVRAERFAVDGVNVNQNPLERVDKMLSGRASAVYKPTQRGNFYVSYGTSLNPSLEGFTYSPADTSLEPEKTYTVEAGSKWDLFGNRLLLSGAVFRVAKTNARTPGINPDDPPTILDGKQVVRGVEIGLAGNVTRAWTLFSAYTFLDSRIEESNNPAEQGNLFSNAPRNSFNVWTSYSFPWRVMLGGGLRYTGRRYNNFQNVRSVDGYWTADAMASVGFTKNVDLRLNLYNMTNEYYFERLGGGHLIPGAGRALLASLNFHF